VEGAMFNSVLPTTFFQGQNRQGQNCLVAIRPQNFISFEPKMLSPSVGV
jgi:hypothetical protein